MAAAPGKDIFSEAQPRDTKAVPQRGSVRRGGSQGTWRFCSMLGWGGARAARVQQLLARSLSEALPALTWPHYFEVLSSSMKERGRQLLQKPPYCSTPWCFLVGEASVGLAPGPTG